MPVKRLFFILFIDSFGFNILTIWLIDSHMLNLLCSMYDEMYEWFRKISF